MYYDDQGNSRNDDGTVNSFSLSQGTLGEQYAVGAHPGDTAADVEYRVRNHRAAWGLDPYTGMPNPTPPPCVSRGIFADMGAFIRAA